MVDQVVARYQEEPVLQAFTAHVYGNGRIVNIIDTIAVAEDEVIYWVKVTLFCELDVRKEVFPLALRNIDQWRACVENDVLHGGAHLVLTESEVIDCHLPMHIRVDVHPIDAVARRIELIIPPKLIYNCLVISTVVHEWLLRLILQVHGKHTTVDNAVFL